MATPDATTDKLTELAGGAVSVEDQSPNASPATDVEIILDDGDELPPNSPTTHRNQSRISRVFSMTREPYKQLGCCGAIKQVFYPIKSFETTFNELGDGVTEIMLCPEAFRMCFYVYFMFFLFIAILISSRWAETDLNDNPILNRFGTNNLCVYLDDPPFSTFGLTLWFPALVMLLSYELLDYVRLYDHYLDTGCDEVHRGFFIYYTVSTVVETFSVIVFPQVFATSPTENIYVHSMPYFMILYALWFILLKRFLYLWRVGAFNHWDGAIWYMSCVYCAVSAVTVVIKIATGVPNLFGAKLWEYDSWDWLGPLVSFNGNLYLFLNMLCPLIIYGIIGKEMDTVVITINRLQPSRLKLRNE